MTRRYLNRVVSSAFLSRITRGDSVQNSFLAPYSELDRLAKQAHDDQKAAKSESNSREGVSRLIDAVFAIPRSFEIPSEVRELLKPLLTSAHQRHAAKRVSDANFATGVHEEQIASVMSDFFMKMKAPPAAKITSHQIRVIRMLSLSRNPLFMGEGMTTALSKVGDSINPYMSPLQATHLSLTTADQKLINPDYQLEPEAWETAHRNKMAERKTRLVEKQKLIASGKTYATRYSAFLSSNDFGTKLRKSLDDGFQQMTNDDILSLVTSTISVLG